MIRLIYSVLVLLSTSPWLFTSLIVLQSFLVYWFLGLELSSDHGLGSGKVSLAVLVLSARDHFDQRRVLRETWFNQKISDVGNVSIKFHFVIGEYDCEVPEKYREDNYGCSEWTSNATEDLKADVYSHLDSPVNDKTRFHKLSNGFSFKIYHDVLLKKIGCLLSCPCDNVILKNAVTHEVLLNQSFLIHGDNQTSGYLYQDLMPVLLLPRGFIGLLLATSKKNLECESMKTTTWNTFEKLFKVLRVYRDLNHFESKLFTGDELVKTSLACQLSDYRDYVTTIVDQQAQSEFNRLQSNVITNRLREEIEQFNDIVLVDVVDVYRNLARKLAKGIERIVYGVENFEWILKTDDDCYIELANLTRKINLLPKRKSVWWGNFKRNHLINVYGKWTENDFPGSVYPAFACGSGYVISAKIARWIARNIYHLHYFQGEDVSMGIWLSSILPTYLQDEDWSCAGDKHREGQIAICQLNSSQISHFASMKPRSN